MPDNATTRDLRPYAAGHFDLQIDGHAPTGYLKSLDGGWIKTNVMEEAVGSNQYRAKHSSVAEIEPFTVEMGILGSGDMLKWLSKSWTRNPERRHGMATHANFSLRETYSHEFFNALITEATIPAVDGTSKEPGWLKVKFQPEDVKTSTDAYSGDNQGTKMASGTIEKGQKLWSCSNFRFTIDGLPNMNKVAKLEAFTIKQGTKKNYLGRDRLPELEPTKIDFPNLQGQIALHHAGDLMDWYQQFVATGQNAPAAQKDGSLEFLDPRTSATIFRVTFRQMGIVSLNVPGTQANQTEIKRVKFELYCSRMEIDIPRS